MTIRRTVLCFAVALLVASAARRSSAGTGELDAAVYGGSTAGGWVCGPVGRANYAGVGANVRVQQRAADERQGEGWAGTVGAGVEHERVEITNCGEKPCDPEKEIAPAPATLPGGHASAGHQWQHFGVQLGAMAWRGWDENDDEDPKWRAFPELELSAGRRDRTHVIGGVGMPLPTMQRRPGIYGGVRLGRPGDVRVTAMAGAFRLGPSLGGEAGPRADVVVHLPVGEKVAVNAGGSVSGTERGGAGAEASLGASAAF